MKNNNHTQSLKIAAKLSDKETESGKSTHTHELGACETRIHIMKMSIFSSLTIRIRVMLVFVCPT